MRSYGTLVLLLALLLHPASAQSTREELSLQDNVGSLPGRLIREYDDMDYNSFIGLMGRRNTGTNAVPPLTWDMHDVFVGLLGRRSLDSGVPSWRREKRGALFMKNGRFRF